ncbi:MAG: hypothetical protein OEZ34_16190 [Spirochaetia bacterium]|nr:hypothetical protein [Spirochaetia bacterium]
METTVDTLKSLERSDMVLGIGKDYIPHVEQQIRKIIFSIYSVPEGDQTGDLTDRDILSEAVFWSLGELINNANKANNRWAMLRGALFKRVKNENAEIDEKRVLMDIDYAIEHDQSEMLRKYNLQNLDLTTTILKMIETHNINSFALSEKFNKKIDITFRIKNKNNERFLSVNVVNNSPITVIDKKRVEFNLDKIKEDLIQASKDSFQAAVSLYDKPEDHDGGGFGAGLRSIILFLKEGYAPFQKDVIYSRLIQYRSSGNSTIFSVELPIP